MEKHYIIKNTRSKRILRVAIDDLGNGAKFYCIFDTKKEAIGVLKDIEGSEYHIEEGLITEVVGSKKIN
jgi:hypothetical protein